MGCSGRILCSISDVNLAAVLRSGQSFRWTRLASEEWIGPLGQHLWILQQDESGIDFRVLSPKNEPEMDKDKAKVLLDDYFQLSVDLKNLYSCWSRADEAFRKSGEKLPGVRMLRQDPVENLFCFICSSNNNIQRITAMVEKLCVRYGAHIADHGGRPFHAFPAVRRLAAPRVEAELRGMGFGYRARFISETARQLEALGGAGWLRALRAAPYAECHAQLRRLPGVGAKVADCVCLMSLDQPAAVPVDTHVHQLAARHYLPQLRQLKSLTDRAYREVADHFRLVFGDRAGWAQAVLFCGDLNEFKKSGGAASGDGVNACAQKNNRKSVAKPPVVSGGEPDHAAPPAKRRRAAAPARRSVPDLVREELPMTCSGRSEERRSRRKPKRLTVTAS